MPLPDVMEEELEWVDVPPEEEPQQKVDLGACPWCSNCGEELCSSGGILCTECIARIQAGWTPNRDTTPSLAQIALKAEGEGPPRHADGSLWTPDELQEEIAAEHRRQDELARNRCAAQLRAAEGTAPEAGPSEDDGRGAQS